MCVRLIAFLGRNQLSNLIKLLSKDLKRQEKFSKESIWSMICTEKRYKYLAFAMQEIRYIFNFDICALLFNELSRI